MISTGSSTDPGGRALAIDTVMTSFFACRVLDHGTVKMMLDPHNLMSPRVRCLKGENVLREGGSKFDFLKQVKNCVVRATKTDDW